MNRYNPIEEQEEYTGMSRSKTFIIIAIMIAITAAIIAVMIANKVEAKRGKPPKSVVSVEVIPAIKSDYATKVFTNGTIAAETRGNLVAQVTGEIIEIADNFANGGSFKKNDVLLKLDGRDFKTAMQSAQANLSQTKVALSQEKASATQAKKDWKRLGFEGKPTDLVLRKPQLTAATNQRNSAQSAFDKAQLDFSRTRVKAPYDGYVIQKNVALGQFIGAGTVLAEIFSDEGLEVQLPLNQDQFSQLDIANKPSVILQSNLAGGNHQWTATIVRADKIFDTTTRQLNATAKISNPLSDKGLELKIGQYVTATIAGKTAKDVIVIPNQAIREGRYVFIYDDGVLRRKNITLLGQDTDNAIVEGVEIGQLIVTTAVGSSLNGSEAKLLGETTGSPEGKPKNGKSSKNEAATQPKPKKGK